MNWWRSLTSKSNIAYGAFLFCLTYEIMTFENIFGVFMLVFYILEWRFSFCLYFPLRTASPKW